MYERRNNGLRFLSLALTLTMLMAATAFIAHGAFAATTNSDSDSLEAVASDSQGAHLQVTGSRANFSIEADHADLQSALRSIFTQADKQFDVDRGVVGQFSLKLTGQNLSTCLASICRQTLVRYHVDPATGIFHFEQDTDAIKSAFQHINTLNSMMRQQLRDLGIDLPEDSQLDVLNGQTAVKRNSVQSQGAGLGGPSGQDRNSVIGGGGNAGSTLSGRGAQGGLGSNRNSADGSVLRGNTGGTTNTPEKAGTGDAYLESALRSDFLPEGLVMQMLQANGVVAEAGSAAKFSRGYGSLLANNGLVAINTQGVAQPVSDVLSELSRQSGVAILLDPLVPRGARFRMTLTLPACSLPEALNLILPLARLRWRTINNAVYITPAPEFQIFYGSAPTPYVIYGNSLQNNRSQTGNGVSQLPAGAATKQAPGSQNDSSGTPPK